MFDGGEVKVYKIGEVTIPGDMPVEGLILYQSFYFEERSIGLTRNYMAMQNNKQVDRLIRVWQDRVVDVGHVCVIDDGIDIDVQYRVASVQHFTNDEGLKVTDLTLERLGDLYVIAN